MTMVEWSIVVSLIVTGLILVVIEIFFVPGTTFVGLLGFLCLVIGVALRSRFISQEKQREEQSRESQRLQQQGNIFQI
jgi:membrane-bound ClpP family serine protease